MDFARQIEGNRRALLDDIDRRVEAALQPCASDLNDFFDNLFQTTLPTDWRGRWHNFVAEEATKGFFVESKSADELETWIAAWAEYCGLLPFETGSPSQDTEDDARDTPGGPARKHAQPGAAPLYAFEPSEPESAPSASPSDAAAQPSGKRGNQMPFAEASEEIVAEEIGVPRNEKGPGQQTIPGSGKRGYRILDFPHRGPQGSIRIRGTVVEVKASTGSKFGDLSGESRRQIKDAVAFVEQLRSKASLAKDPWVKRLLRNAHVEVFSDLPEPKSGTFTTLIDQKLLEWKPIPRPEPVPIPTGMRPGSGKLTKNSIGKPGLGAAENIALGILISLVEAGVASTVYRESAAMLNELLTQIAQHGDADEAEWAAIESKLNEIANMKQSVLGYVWEFITYGQGSLQEKQAMAMMLLASELGDKFGYANERSWEEMLRGDLGHFKKEFLTGRGGDVYGTATPLRREPRRTQGEF